MKSAKEITLLVVDDDLDLRDAMSFDFKRRGFNVLNAGGGKEAFEIIQQRPVDVVLSDVRMPAGDGVELLKWVKDHNFEIPPVIFVTGFADIRLEEAYNLGAERVFAKPFDRDVVREAVIRAASPKEELWAVSPEVFPCDITIERKFSDFEAAIASKSLNFGRGGMFVSLEGPLPTVGASVRFKIDFETPSSCLIEGYGWVRWTRTQADIEKHLGCGIEFCHLGDKSLAVILEFIKQHKSKAFIPTD